MSITTIQNPANKFQAAAFITKEPVGNAYPNLLFDADVEDYVIEQDYQAEEVKIEEGTLLIGDVTVWFQPDDLEKKPTMLLTVGVQEGNLDPDVLGGVILTRIEDLLVEAAWSKGDVGDWDAQAADREADFAYDSWVDKQMEG